ncbi:hypothetical protein [Pueribacillus sp. YX66]|uniref:hypothetical protein n=1 Tax=Pueribacillus sp. YX66 TaxID=3229242 RepID=UPI00358D1232
MSNQDRPKIKVNKKNEMRTKEVSKIISEGGLEVENMIKKGSPSSKEEKENKSYLIPQNVLITLVGTSCISYFNLLIECNF